MKQQSLTIKVANSNQAIKIVSDCLGDYGGAGLFIFLPTPSIFGKTRPLSLLKIKIQKYQAALLPMQSTAH
jgi:hypothetical protein